MGTAIKHPVPDHVKPSFVMGTLTLNPKRQSALISKITGDGLTLSGTGCFMAICIDMATVGVKGLSCKLAVDRVTGWSSCSVKTTSSLTPCWAKSTTWISLRRRLPAGNSTTTDRPSPPAPGSLLTSSSIVILTRVVFLWLLTLWRPLLPCWYSCKASYLCQTGLSRHL